jgi:hypothetical protein
LITKVKQSWAWLVLGWVTAQMISEPDAVRWLHLVAREGVGEDLGVIPPVCVKYQRLLNKKANKLYNFFSFF